ncbi:hypothetical protein [Lonepinella sp. BR2882]|uniref:hypothetical protein n=1 Tax=Lonepinella sp. BR2882 TaxID=3095283 RepID=UPI003F6DAF3A
MANLSKSQILTVIRYTLVLFFKDILLIAMVFSLAFTVNTLFCYGETAITGTEKTGLFDLNLIYWIILLSGIISLFTYGVLLVIRIVKVSIPSKGVDSVYYVHNENCDKPYPADK